MTVLQLIQQAAAEMGVTQPTYVIGNTNLDAVQMLALINAVGYELQNEYPWQALQKEYRFATQSSVLAGTTTNGSPIVTGISSTAGLDTTYMVQGTGVLQDTYIQSVDSGTQVTLSNAATASGSQSLTFGKTKYSLPSDFIGLVDNTEFDKSRRWTMMGPETAQQWQWLKSSYISTGPRIRFRIMGGYLQTWPIITSGDILGFEYRSNAWVTAAGGTAKSLFSVDTDTCVFPDRVMVLGLKRKYFEIKGFDTTAIERDYQQQLDIAKSKDHGAPMLSMRPDISGILIGYNNIPDSGYGV